MFGAIFWSCVRTLIMLLLLIMLVDGDYTSMADFYHLHTGMVWSMALASGVVFCGDWLLLKGQWSNRMHCLFSGDDYQPWGTWWDFWGSVFSAVQLVILITALKVAWPGAFADRPLKQVETATTVMVPSRGLGR